MTKTIALSVIFMMAAHASLAASQTCPPGSYWDSRDQMCIYDNGR